MRVIGLIDLDAFYAQCEAVRLGLPASTTPIVVLQWQMVLAVSYPARKLGIKRGMFYNDCKHHSDCYFIHVETYSVDDSIGDQFGDQFGNQFDVEKLEDVDGVRNLVEDGSKHDTDENGE